MHFWFIYVSYIVSYMDAFMHFINAKVHGPSSRTTPNNNSQTNCKSHYSLHYTTKRLGPRGDGPLSCPKAAPFGGNPGGFGKRGGGPPSQPGLPPSAGGTKPDRAQEGPPECPERNPPRRTKNKTLTMTGQKWVQRVNP